MIIDELNKKIADIESLANDKTSTIESKVSDLTDGLLMVADAVDIIPEMVDEKITAITREFSTIKDSVSKVKAQKGEKGAKGEKGDSIKGDKGDNGKDGSPDTGEQIVDKLNELEGILDTKVLKDFTMPDVKDLERQINTIGNQTLRLLSRPTTTTSSSFTGVTTDATLTGLGTDASPLSVVATSASDVAVTVRAATTAALAGSPTYDNGISGVGATLTRGTNGILPNQDGRTLQVADRLLVKNQSSTLQNGVYEVTSLGSVSTPWVLTRATDADTTSQLDELVVTVSEGSTNRGTVWGQQTNNPVVGTSAITFATVVSTAVTQATSGTQVAGQVPYWTGTTRQLSKGDNLFYRNPITKETSIGTSFSELTSGYSDAIATMYTGVFASLYGGGTVISDPADATNFALNISIIGEDGKPNRTLVGGVRGNGSFLGMIEAGQHDATYDKPYFQYTAQINGQGGGEDFRNILVSDASGTRIKSDNLFLLDATEGKIRLRTNLFSSDWWEIPVVAGTDGYVLTAHGNGAEATWEPAGGATITEGAPTQADRAEVDMTVLNTDYDELVGTQLTFGTVPNQTVLEYYNSSETPPSLPILGISLTYNQAQSLYAVGSAYSNGDTITIGSRTYTLQDTLTNVDGNIQRDVDDLVTAQNIVDAINLTGTPGTQYASAMTANTEVSATVSAPNFTAVALEYGPSGNSITLSTVSANGNAWNTSTLEGGSQPTTDNVAALTQDKITKNYILADEKLINASYSSGDTLSVYVERPGTYGNGIAVDSTNDTAVTPATTTTLGGLDNGTTGSVGALRKGVVEVISSGNTLKIDSLFTAISDNVWMITSSTNNNSVGNAYDWTNV